MKCSPDQRYRATRLAKTAPKDPTELALWKIFQQKPSDPNVEWAWSVFEEVYEREVLNAFLLAGATDEQIWTTLRVPNAVVQAYRYLFFDTQAFRDELHILSWIRKYEEGHYGTPQGVQLLKDALMRGVPGLIWNYCRDSTLTLDPEHVQRQAMVDAYFLGRTCRVLTPGSTEARAAKSYMDTALQLASTIIRQHKKDNTNDAALIIKLMHREMTSSIEDVHPEDVPLH